MINVDDVSSIDIIDILLDKMNKSKGFPALAKTVNSVLDSLNYENINSLDIANTISGDFSLTQKVLKLVNSPMYASIGKDISTITQAVKVLGFDAVSHLALSVKVIDSLTISPTDLTSELDKTILAADIARDISPKELCEDATIAALMFNLGMLLVSHYLKDEMAKINALVSQGHSLEVASKSVLSLSFTSLGVSIATRWKFPCKVLSIIDGTGDPTIIGLAKVSNTTATLIVEGKSSELAEYLVRASLEYDISLDSLQKVATDKVKAREYPSVISNRRVSLELDLVDILNELKGHEESSLEVFTTKLFNILAIPLGTTRILFLMKTSSNDFKIRHGVGKDIEELHSILKVSAAGATNVFNAVVLKNADLMISDATKIKKTAYPEGFDLDRFNVISFLILPVCVGSTVVGLFYFDWAVERKLNTAELKVIHEIRNLLIKYLPKI